jgi:hypothetical protein
MIDIITLEIYPIRTPILSPAFATYNWKSSIPISVPIRIRLGKPSVNWAQG